MKRAELDGLEMPASQLRITQACVFKYSVLFPFVNGPFSFL
jgi:hypothetical protein